MVSCCSNHFCFGGLGSYKMELVNGIRSIDGLCIGLCCCDIGQMVDFSLDYIFGIGIFGGETAF